MQERLVFTCVVLRHAGSDAGELPLDGGLLRYSGGSRQVRRACKRFTPLRAHRRLRPKETGDVRTPFGATLGLAIAFIALAALQPECPRADLRQRSNSGGHRERWLDQSSRSGALLFGRAQQLVSTRSSPSMTYPAARRSSANWWFSAQPLQPDNDGRLS